MQIFFTPRTFRLFPFTAIIAELKSIKVLIKSFVILAGVSDLSFLPMLNGKNIKNIVEFDLVSKNKNFFYDEVLLICSQLNGDCVIPKTTELD